MTKEQLDAAVKALQDAFDKQEAEKAAEANVVNLRNTVVSAVAGTGGIGARQDLFVLARAKIYIPREPTDSDKGNPTGWAYREFQEAGLTEVSAPNGPLERWGPAGAYPTQPETWIPAFQFVLEHYQAGTDSIEADHANRIAADKDRAANMPGIGFPIWTHEQCDAVLASFDAAQSAEAKWNRSNRGGDSRGISNAEYIALQNRGVTTQIINSNIEKYNP